MMDKTPGPEDLTPFIIYLASEAAAQISGSVFFVSGSSVGKYSDMEIKKSITKKDGDRWTVEELEQQVPQNLLAQG